MPFVAAVSEHPVIATAVGEVAGRVLEQLGPAPDLAVLFVGSAGTGALEDVVAAVRALVRPVVLVGCTAAAVIVDEIETSTGGLALWAGAGFDATATLEPTAGAAFVLADPFTHQAGAAPTGFASAARGPGGNRLVLDGDIYGDGAVAVTVDGIDVDARRGPTLELVDLPGPPADGALLFAGDPGPAGSVLPTEAVGGAPLGGMRAAHRDRAASTLVVFRH